ncbi:hypothetical protein APHAL10511_004358 [Amanita phalloides]|nr:hypothetical protein APHAL10511_004358 [Amanita phalloides]
MIKNKRRKTLGETNELENSKNAVLPSKDNETEPYDERAREKEKDVAAAAAAAVLAELGIDDHPKKHKKQRKVTKEDESQVAPVTSMEPTVVGDKIRSGLKKKEKNKVKNMVAPRTGISTLEEEQKRKSEKEKSTGGPVTGFGAPFVERALTPDDRSEKANKNNKRKLAESQSFDGRAVTNGTDDAGSGNRLKKKKRSSKIIDPSEDKTLSEQALKALVYAFSEYQSPAEWKFSKARQNWLIRNIWSSTMIPDEHMPLLLWYLRNVKGGVRNALIKTCQDQLKYKGAVRSFRKELEDAF